MPTVFSQTQDGARGQAEKRKCCGTAYSGGGKRVLPYLVEFLLAITHQVLTKENCLEIEEHTHTVIIIIKNINV